MEYKFNKNEEGYPEYVRQKTKGYKKRFYHLVREYKIDPINERKLEIIWDNDVDVKVDHETMWEFLDELDTYYNMKVGLEEMENLLEVFMEKYYDYRSH